MLLLLLPTPLRRMLCDRSLSFHSFCHSVNRITEERGNGRRTNWQARARGNSLEVIDFWLWISAWIQEHFFIFFTTTNRRFSDIC